MRDETSAPEPSHAEIGRLVVERARDRRERNLVERYEAALRAFVVAAREPETAWEAIVYPLAWEVPCRAVGADDPARRNALRTVLDLHAEALRAFLWQHGEVETCDGIYKLDGGGGLSFSPLGPDPWEARP